MCGGGGGGGGGERGRSRQVIEGGRERRESGVQDEGMEGVWLLRTDLP